MSKTTTAVCNVTLQLATPQLRLVLEALQEKEVRLLQLLQTTDDDYEIAEVRVALAGLRMLHHRMLQKIQQN